MYQPSQFLLLLLLLLLVVASTPLISAAPALSERAAATCTFTDAATAVKSKTSCPTITLNNIVVPAGVTLDLSGLTAGTHVIFSGTTTFGYQEWAGPLISISGKSITVRGSAGHLIDGNGAQWWDGKGTDGGKTKPKFFAAHDLSSSTISGLNFKNSPCQLMSINGASNLTVSGVVMNNAMNALATNTDAFDVGSSNGVYISGAKIVNQDDCLAINSGIDISFTGGSCTGGHGLSIGSIGGRTDNIVKDVTISSSTITNSANGIRIKTVSNIVYKDITLSGITSYGVVIEQDYLNGGPTGKPTTGVPITGLSLTNVKGTVAGAGTTVKILCGTGSCSGWTWSGVSVTGGKKSAACSGIPTGASC